MGQSPCRRPRPPRCIFSTAVDCAAAVGGGARHEGGRPASNVPTPPQEVPRASSPGRAPKPPPLVSTPCTTRAQPSGRGNLVGCAGVPPGCGTVVGWRLPNPPKQVSVGAGLGPCATQHRCRRPFSQDWRLQGSLVSAHSVHSCTRKEHPCARGSVTCALVAGSLRGGNTVFASTGVLTPLGQLPLLTAVKHALPSRAVEPARSCRPRLDSGQPTGRTHARGRAAGQSHAGRRRPAILRAPTLCWHTARAALG